MKSREACLAWLRASARPSAGVDSRLLPFGFCPAKVDERARQILWDGFIPHPCLALDWIAREFPACRGLDQVGRKQVWKFYEAHGHLAPKTLADYGYALRLLWEILGRAGGPPWPEACGAGDRAPLPGLPQEDARLTDVVVRGG